MKMCKECGLLVHVKEKSLFVCFLFFIHEIAGKKNVDVIVNNEQVLLTA